MNQGNEMREFTACVRTAKVTETVTIKAQSPEQAEAKLLRLGYVEVVGVL